MGYTIVRVEAADRNVMRRTMLLASVSTKAQAVAALKRHLATYLDHGWIAEQGQWWAWGQDSKQYELWLEGVGSRDLPKFN